MSNDRKWLERKCVRIWKENSQCSKNFLGTGSLISSIHILTAAHVVKKYENKKIIVTGMAWSSERTIRDTPRYHNSTSSHALNRDIALLCLAESEQTSELPIPLMDKNNLVKIQDQSLTIAGFAEPFEAGLKFVVSNKENYQDSIDAIVVSDAVEHGMSGGPAIRDRRLVGVVYATSPEKHKTYIVPLAAIKDFLTQHVAVKETSKKSNSHIPKKWVRYINRMDQISDLARFIDGNFSRVQDDDIISNKPIITLLSCTEDDRHRYLRQRFEKGEYCFNPSSHYSGLLKGMQVYDVEFPSKEPNRSDEALGRMIDRLKSHLSAQSRDPVDIREALNGVFDIQCIFSTITCKSEELEPKRETLLKKWINFWEQVAGQKDAGESLLNHQVIVILSILENCKENSQPSKKQSLFSKFFKAKKQGRCIRELVQEWPNRRRNAVHFDKFATLSLIRQAHVEEWIKTLVRHIDGLGDIIDDVLVEIPSIIPSDGVNLSSFTDQCLDKINYNISKF